MMRGTWLDNRIGGSPHWVFCEEDELMQVPDELRQCVCFVRGQRGSESRIGTAFFLAVPLDVDEQAAIYVVTARHCIMPDDAADKAPFEKVSLRLNTRAGGSEWIDTRLADWRLHERADAAVLAYAPPVDEFEYMYYPAHGGATRQFISEHHLGPGADVLITGLLIHHPGKTRLLPIVRVGNIAAFPEEPIRLSTGADRATLVEVRSLGGLSGSPAFLHLPDWVRDREGNLLRLQGAEGWARGGPNFLLGLVHGFYPTRENDPDHIGAELNTGISVIVPVERIHDLIDSPEYVEVRETLKKQIEDKNIPTPASTTATAAADSEFERFENLTRKLAKVTKKELDEQRKREKS